DVLLGIKAGGEDLDQDQADQADAIGDQGPGSHQRRLIVKFPVMEQGGSQRLSQYCQRNGSWQGQQKGQAQAPVQQGGIFILVALGMRPRQAGQQDGAQGHTQQTGG